MTVDMMPSECIPNTSGIWELAKHGFDVQELSLWYLKLCRIQTYIFEERKVASSATL